jgi:hypothetical protein
MDFLYRESYFLALVTIIWHIDMCEITILKEMIMSKLMNRATCLMLSVLFPAMLCGAAAGKIIYVDDDAAGANDGSSWENAYVYLQDALADANSAEKPVEILVAQGIYKPDQGAYQTPGDREATFRLMNGVTLKGGYAGLGEPHPNARDVELYESVLSGDLNGDDVQVDDFELDDPWDLLDEPTRVENSYNVVTGSGTDHSGVLDGFTITAGNTDRDYSGGFAAPRGPDDDRWRLTRGAGMLNIFGSPTVSNCTFSVNSAFSGGAMCNFGCNLTLTNCSFRENHSLSGGGMYNGKSSLILTDCTFTENVAYYGRGGGIANSDSSLTLTDCAFIRNSAESGGGMDKGIATLVNCVFIANEANRGGGLQSVSSTLTNCTFIANKARDWGVGMRSGPGGNTVTNCTFRGNSAGICGAAIFIGLSKNLVITNCTLTGNSAPNGNALACDEFFRDPSLPSNVELTNCIIWDSGNEIRNDDGSSIAISYSDIQGGRVGIYDPHGVVAWGQGNIDADPLFADPGHWVDVNDPNVIVEPSDPNNDLWVNGDYHLKSEAGRWDPNTESWIIDDVTSPCIDAGDPLTPVMYEPHPRGCFINMGAYGGTEEASKSPYNCR